MFQLCNTGNFVYPPDALQGFGFYKTSTSKQQNLLAKAKQGLKKYLIS
ncbi:hypothetical protein M23134_04394 [Microscilla marina ATCC 23134]|uniref:Uncharacterized protein n=1 Tax=Microscilla marina ATCC 23134 TaxID=313606 RepID=A1ZM15_MICM2|nr:hypothetical protein M23134_04394 [Microscilla marina ATCC 23134]